uniref:DUF86 domain-containing protein n=1 Tax=Geobacter sp. (strain M21) TaxID=443144 RepID=C6E6Y5_GEOSM
MSSERDIRDYLVDMNDALQSIREFTQDMSYDEFCNDKKTIYAVTRAFEILGEAAKHVDEGTRCRYPGVPWRMIAGMRDKLIHEYFGIALDIVWSSVQEDLPELQRDLEPVLEELVKNYA